MKCYAQFYLAGCAAPLPDDYEEFHSIADAKREFLRKHEEVSRYAEGPSEMLVFFGKPDKDAPYPCDGIEPDRGVPDGAVWWYSTTVIPRPTTKRLHSAEQGPDQ